MNSDAFFKHASNHQVAEKSASLNSGDCFVLLTPATMYCWEGGLSNDDEKQCSQVRIMPTLCMRRSK